MFAGHEHVGALWDTLTDRFVFPRERLRRALIDFEGARLHEADWPLALRILAEGIRIDAAVCDGLLPADAAQVEGLLARMTQFAAAYWNLDLPAAESAGRRKHL